MAQVAGGDANTELKKIAAGLGVDLSGIGGGGNAMDSSPPIYFGEMGKYTADGDVLRAKGGRNKYGGTTTKPMEQANAAFYELSQTQLIEFQRRLVGAGVLDPDKLRLGDYDDDTYAAWSAINERAAKFYAVGKKVTPNDVLGMIERAYDPRQEEPDKAAARANLLASFGTDLHVYRRSDPASLRQTAEAAFQQALGRKPKKDELEKFVNNFLGSERSNQSAGFAKQDELTAASRDRALSAFDAAEAGGAGGPVASAATEEGMSESEVLMNRLQRFIADAPGKIGLGKTTRDLATQKRLWAEYQAGTGPMAARPGTSKHGDGRANDLKYENEKVRQWALANASKYGLAFPIYDPKKPRSKDESWHVEVLVGPGTGRGSASSTPTGPGAAPISTSMTDQAQDAGARAIEFARDSNPTETAAYDIGGQFNNLLSILQKGVV